MKTCPTCRRTYEDDGLNFCLEDGAVLNLVSAGSAPTIVMGQPRLTDPTPREYGAQMGAPVPNAPAYSMQPKKRSSKTWVWVLGIFGILILVCGGGFAGFFFYLASVANTNSSFKGPPNSPTDRNRNGFTRASPTMSPAETSAKAVDLSEWVEEPTTWLETEYADGEFFMTSKQSGYYYVLVAKKDEFSGASVARVTVRNLRDQAAELGYGLVFHSDMTALTNDYAFLIDTKRKKYRVVRHEAEQEKTITAWTASDLIKQGAEPNMLEARDKGEKIELYINGKLATAITNKQGPKGGVPGLYVGAGAKIGFRKLEVVK